MHPWIKNTFGVAAIGLVALGTVWAVRRSHAPGQLDVISAQAMDMSQMRPPTGAAPVALAAVRRGALDDTVTYTGSVAAFNAQDVSPRIAGTLLSVPVYPGDSVRAGQLLARLDTSQIGPQAAQAAAQARQAQIGASVAHLTHHLHHQAELAQAAAQVGAARQGVLDAQAQAQADQDAIGDARAGVRSAQAGADYWRTEIAREGQLADAGAVSRQEYQSEQSQAQAADALLAQAQARAGQAEATAQSARAKVSGARRQVDAAQAGVRMAQADIAVAGGQAAQAEAGAAAAGAAAQAAAVQRGYARLTAPFAGVVTARPVAPGTLVQPGTVILRLAEIDRVRVQANVAVEDAAGVRVGSPVRITAPGGGAPVAARVTAVFPDASADTRTAVVEAVVANPGHRLLPGSFVTVRISKAAVADRLLVPASAVVSEGGASSLWVAGGGAAAPASYQCEKCHMTYSAADARKNDYRDPMDGGRLLPVAPAPSPAADGLTAHRVAVRAGASDGAWTEVSADGLAAGTRVVAHGQAGLTDGAPVVATAWGPDGPQSLPAVSASRGRTLYKCEKCGMTYSAADAKKDNFVDPMDGGRLVPVAPPAPAATGRMPGMKM